MKTTDKILLLVSFPIILIFLAAIASQYYALIYTKEINQQMQQELFQSQIMFSTKFTTLISHQLNREAQKIPIISNLLNKFVSKIFADKVKLQYSHRNTLVHIEQLYSNKEDPFLISLYHKNNLLVNSWYHKNHTSINTLDKQAQQTLANIYRFNVLQKSIAYENTINNYSNGRKLLLNDMLYVMQYQGLFITSGKNSTFKKYPQCLGSGLFNYDARCRPWYVGTADKIPLQMYAPEFVLTRNFSLIVSLFCQKIDYFNQTLISSDTLGVLCISVSLSQFQSYFSNFANSTKQLYLIEPKSQSILYQSNLYEGMTSLYNLTQVELKYIQKKEEASNLNNTIKEYFSMFNYMQLNESDIQEFGKIESYSKQVYYNRNGSMTLAILSPVMVYEKLPVYEGVAVPSDRQKYNVDIPFLQINIISDEELRAQANKIEQFFSRYFLFVNIVLGLVGLVSIIVTLIYSFGIRNMINASVTQLTQVLKKMNNIELSKHLIDTDINHMFLSYETQQLYQSFQGIYSILLFTSENFFQSNDTQTLLRLTRNIEFFKQFGNIEAVGITHNNIGSIFLSQGHFFQALEEFNTSIIYAKYEIEEFCKAYPLSLSSFLISEFCFQNIIIDSLSQPKKKEENPSHFSSIAQSKSRGSSQKSRGISNSHNKMQNLESAQTNFDGKCLSSQQLQILNQMKNIKIDKQIKLKLLTEEFSEQSIQLLQNLFQRKRNYLVTLLSFQESLELEARSSTVREYNFWSEIKILLKDLLYISQHLPTSEIIEIEVNTLLQKCYLQLKKKEKAYKLSQNIEISIANLNKLVSKQKIQKQQDDSKTKKLFNSNAPPISPEPKSFNASFLQDQKLEESNSFNLQNSRCQDNRKEEITSVNMVNNKRNTTQEYKYNSKKIYQQNLSVQQESNNKILLNKSRESRFDKSNIQLLESFTKPIAKDLELNKSPISNQQKNLEFLFKMRRKLHIQIDNSSQLQNYYSIDNLELIYYFSKAQGLLQSNQFKKAAEILTNLLESKKQIISHYPFKIISLLKQIFEGQELVSKNLNQLYQKFNRNTTIQAAMIFDCVGNNKLLFKSVQLASDVVSSVLESNKDQFGVVLVDQQQRLIQSFMTLTNFQQIKDIMNKIIENIINVFTQNENNQFTTFISQFCEEIQAQDLSFKTNDSFNNQYNFSFKQIDTDSPCNKFINKNNKINFKNLNTQEIQIEEQNQEENFSSLDQVNAAQKTNIQNYLIYPNSSNFLSANQQNNQKQQYSKKLQLQSFIQKMQMLKGDDEQIYQNFHNFSQELPSVQQQGRTEMTKQYYFHMSIHKTLSDLFQNQIEYTNLIKKVFNLQNSQLKTKVNHLQQRYIIYSTDEIILCKNALFFYLCQILFVLNIKVVLFVEIKGNSFIEQLPDQTYYYKSVDIFRVFYTNQQVLTYLKTSRNKFQNTFYATIIQHY